jgi:hypothetical protein
MSTLKHPKGTTMANRFDKAKQVRSALSWKMTLHISGTRENQMHYYNEQYGISLGIFTPKIDEFDFGPPKSFYKVDGNKRTFRSLAAALRVAKNPKRMAQRQWKAGTP